MAQKLKIDIVAKDRSKQAFSGLKGSLARIKASVFNLRNAFIGLGAGLVIRNIVNTGKQIENLQVQLKFLFGSAQEGAKAFDEMAKFAAKVPFSLEEIQKGSGVLAVVSEDAEELAHLMKITGNVAAVTGLDFKTTAEQIQRSLSAGISAADLFRDKGVKEMLGFKAGATASIEETAAAFERVFGVGGKFDGATDELAKTFSGTLSMIGDKYFNFKRVLLDAGFFSELKKQFGDLNKSLEQNSEFLDKIAITIGTTLAVAVEGLANGMKLLVKHSTLLMEALKILISLKIAFMFLKWGRALAPIVASLITIVSLTGAGLIAAGLASAAGIAAYLKLGSVLDDLEKKINSNYEASRKIINPFEETRQVVKKISEEATKLDEAFKKAFNLNRISRSHDAMHEMMNETNEQAKTFLDIWREINEKELKKFSDALKNAKTIIAEGLNQGIKLFSDALARSVILGEKLGETFRRMAQDIAIKLLSALINWGIQLAIAWAYTKYIKKEEQDITAELNKQKKIRATMMLMSGNPLGFLGFFQHGGAVSKGNPVVVGERGPELFVPNTSGQITQNARGTGGGPVNVNFSITTLDASGFNDMLINNRGTISSIINEAVNERGARSIV